MFKKKRFWILVDACGKDFPLLAKFCLWVCQLVQCPAAQLLPYAPRMSQQFPSGLCWWWSTLNGTGLLPCVLVWVHQDQTNGIEKRLSGYDTPAKGAAPRLSLLCCLRSYRRPVGFGEKKYIYKREREAKTSPLVSHLSWQDMEGYFIPMV